MSVLTFSLSGKSESPTRFVARARQFEIVVDEPAALGGADTAANPVEYILAGFAGCLNVVGHLVARDLGFELHRLEVSLQGDIDPARFLGQVTEQRAGYQGLQVTLTPHADASPEILALWLQQVTDRCPVHDNLRQETPISLVLSENVYPKWN